MAEGFVGCISRVEFDEIIPLKLYFQEDSQKLGNIQVILEACSTSTVLETIFFLWLVISMGVGTYNYTFKSVVFESVHAKSVKKIFWSLRMVQKIICDLKMTLKV